jgi:hypothetical protein
VAAARTAASAAMLKTLKEKAPCWDDVVVSPLTTLPGEKQVEYMFSYRASQGTTPLQLIVSLAIASVSATEIIKVCAYYLMVGFKSLCARQQDQYQPQVALPFRQEQYHQITLTSYIQS